MIDPKLKEALWGILAFAILAGALMYIAAAFVRTLIFLCY